MGLDSVALLWNLESFFGIPVTNEEAEKMDTVQDFTNVAALHLDVTNDDLYRKNEMFKNLADALKKVTVLREPLREEDFIFDLLDPSEIIAWERVSQLLDLQVPMPRTENGKLKSITKFMYRPQYDWRKITVDQFILALCARNYEKLIDPKTIKTKFEILVATVGIIENSGVDVYEIHPQSNFVNDFGID